MKAREISRLALLAAATFVMAVLLSASVAPPAIPPASLPLVLAVDPAKSKIHWTLGARAHTVHGTFNLQQGTLQIDPASGKASGEIVAFATSGDSGNSGRDEKMHQEVLESGKFAEIIFKPDRVEGTVNREGKSSVQLHGILTLHGADHEMEIPAEAEINADHWTGSAKFSVPYVQWGLRNPGNFFLRVSKSVDVELELSGTVQSPPAS